MMNPFAPHSAPVASWRPHTPMPKMGITCKLKTEHSKRPLIFIQFKDKTKAPTVLFFIRLPQEHWVKWRFWLIQVCRGQKKCYLIHSCYDYHKEKKNVAGGMLIHSVSVPFRRPCFGSLKVPHTLATQFAHQQLQRCDNSHLFNWKALHARTQKHSPTFTLTGRVLSHRCNNIWAARAVALGKTHLPVLAKPKGNIQKA